MDARGSGVSPMVGHGISDVTSSGSANTEFVNTSSFVYLAVFEKFNKVQFEFHVK
jgi:hypothetical protein